jgi:hypothetical protein
MDKSSDEAVRRSMRPATIGLQSTVRHIEQRRASYLKRRILQASIIGKNQRKKFSA